MLDETPTPPHQKLSKTQKPDKLCAQKEINTTCFMKLLTRLTEVVIRKPKVVVDALLNVSN